MNNIHKYNHNHKVEYILLHRNNILNLKQNHKKNNN